MRTLSLKFLIICFVILMFLVNKTYAQSLPQIYVHTDRDIYFPGDMVWYKVYILRDGKLDPTIRNVYMDWGDDNGKVIKSSVNLMTDGISVGNFEVPMESNLDVLLLNAYTAPIAERKDLGYFRSFAIAQKSYIKPKEVNLENTALQIKSDNSNGILQIDDSDEDKIYIVVVPIKDQDILLKARFNYTTLFEEKITLKSGKKIRIPLLKSDISSGVLQVRAYDLNNSLVSKAIEIINLDDLVVKTEVIVNNQTLSIQIPANEIATLSMSVLQPELPVDTSRNIFSDLVLRNYVDGKIPYSIWTSSNQLNTLNWNWQDVPNKYTASNQEEILKLSAKLIMKPNDLKKFVKKLNDIKSSGSVFRGISVSSQATNENDPTFNLYPLGDNLEIIMPDMTFFGEMFLKTRVADPELDGIPFMTEYTFKKIPVSDQISKPIWEDLKDTYDLKSKWLPSFDDYSEYLSNIIDTVTVTGNRNLNLVRKYDAMNANLNDESEIFDPRLDKAAIKYGYNFEDYLPIMRSKRGAIFNDITKLAFFLNNRQVDFGEVRSLFMKNIAYVRVYYNPNLIPGYIPKNATNVVRAGIQVVEIPPEELRKVYAIDEKIEGYVEPKTFDQIGKMTIWWNPFVIVDGQLGATTIKLPVELIGKRINIQGVTNSGKLVYFNEVVN